MSDNKKDKRFKHAPDSDKWWDAAGRVALHYVDSINTCRDCNGPVVAGYCCLHCGSNNP